MSLTLVGENALKSTQPITSIWGFSNISHIQHGVLIVYQSPTTSMKNETT